MVGADRCGKTSLLVRVLFDEFEGSYAPSLEDNYRLSVVQGYKVKDFTRVIVSSLYAILCYCLRIRDTVLLSPDTLYCLQEYNIDILDTSGLDVYRSEWERVSSITLFTFVN